MPDLIGTTYEPRWRVWFKFDGRLVFADVAAADASSAEKHARDAICGMLEFQSAAVIHPGDCSPGNMGTRP